PPLDAVNLGMMHDLARRFPDCPIGYSDHTVPGPQPSVPALAVAAGAQVIEKHFTFDRTRPGYDHEISADYEDLAAMIREFRLVQAVLGCEAKAPLEVESRARRLGRRSVVAAVDIAAGSTIASDVLAIQPPGTGV